MFMPSAVAAAGGIVIKGAYTMTAGAGAFLTGFQRGNFGTLDPDLPVIVRLDTNTLLSNEFRFVLDGENHPNDDDLFAQIQMTGTFQAGGPTETVLRTAMAYNPTDAGQTSWTLASSGFEFTDTNSYSVDIT